MYSEYTLRVFNTAAGGLHLCWACVLCLVWELNRRGDGSRRDLIYPLYSSYSAWNATSLQFLSKSGCDPPKSMRIGKMLVSPAWTHAGVSLSLHWLVVSFFMLSAFFQLAAASLPRRLVPNHVVRFVEYSFSASVMIVAIGLQLGIMNAQSILLLAALTWTTNMIGLVAEILLTQAGKSQPTQAGKSQPRAFMRLPSEQIRYLRANKDKADGIHGECEQDDLGELAITLKQGAWIAHFTAWVTQAVVFYVLLSQFHGSQYTCQNGEDVAVSAPKFVWAIVYVELILFATFGFIQTLQLFGAVTPVSAEVGYLVLSVCSKSALGGLVYGGNFI
jgi:hypothetical protein